MEILPNNIYNMDCIQGMKLIEKETVDLICSDPPFGLLFNGKQSNYNRDKDLVTDSYNEVSCENYYEFTKSWLSESKRILKENGSIYIFSSWNNLREVLNVIHDLNLNLINQIIWKYNFGVFCKKKYISSHYNLLYVCKNKKLVSLNKDCRFNNTKDQYADMSSVWDIPREYWTNKRKTPTKLPKEIISKIISYSSNENDLIVDPFMGSGQVPFIARELKRNYIGFEIEKENFLFSKERLETGQYFLT